MNECILQTIRAKFLPNVVACEVTKLKMGLFFTSEPRKIGARTLGWIGNVLT